MKHFLIQVETRDGENEYTDYFLSKAKNIEEADKTAEKKAEKNFLVDGDYRLIEVKEIQEIKAEEAKILRRLSIAYYY